MKRRPRIEHRIQELIRDMQWGPSAIYDLSAEYDLSEDEVLSAHTRAVTELQENMKASKENGTLRAEMVMQMRELSRRAATRKRFVMSEDGPVEYDDPDIKGAVMALQSAATIAGVAQDKGEEDEQLSVAELKSRVVALLGEKSNPPPGGEQQEE